MVQSDVFYVLEMRRLDRTFALSRFFYPVGCELIRLTQKANFISSIFPEAKIISFETCISVSEREKEMKKQLKKLKCQIYH